MSAYKQLLSTDFIQSPFEVNHSFTSNFTANVSESIDGIVRLTGSFGDPNESNIPTTPAVPSRWIFTDEGAYNGVSRNTDMGGMWGLEFPMATGRLDSTAYYKAILIGTSTDPTQELTLTQRLTFTTPEPGWTGNFASSFPSTAPETPTTTAIGGGLDIDGFPNGQNNTIEFLLTNLGDFNAQTFNFTITMTDPPLNIANWTFTLRLENANFIPGQPAIPGVTITEEQRQSRRRYRQIDELYYRDINRGSYEHYLQSTLDTRNALPTSSIGIISVPSTLFGEYISPTSFRFETNGGNIITDDGEGNILQNGNNVGNIIYPHGMVILNSGSINNFIRGGATASFESNYTIIEQQIQVSVRDNEFNYPQNPSSITGSDSYLGFVTASYFSPYVTTIGLYNDYNDLLAVAKLAQPVPLSQTTDTNFIINLDL